MLRSSAILFLALTSPAMAQEYYLHFQSPSGNIACYMDGLEGFVRCDIGQTSVQSYRKRPTDCDLDYGNAFAIATGDMRGQALCYGDTVAMPDLPMLEYGEAVSLKGVSCTSTQSGMRCVNAVGHGFDISKAKQSLF